MKIIYKSLLNDEKGGILIELLLSLTIVFTIIPFVISYQKQRYERAENISIINTLNEIRNNLEEYIQNNKIFLNSNQKNIIRVNIDELPNHNISSKKYKDKIQIRIIKKINSNKSINLQGFIIFDDKKITPIKTKEILNISDDKFGFIEGNKVYGAFDNWKNNINKLGMSDLQGIVNSTNNFIENSEKYILRINSDNPADSTMLSDLNLNYHNITNSKFINSYSINVNNKLFTKEIKTDELEFENLTNINKNLNINKAIVYGSLSSDNSNLKISGKLKFETLANFKNINTDKIWVMNINLYGLNAQKNSVIDINKNLDIGNGNITSKYITVGFDGSTTQKLNITKRIEDSLNPKYYWDITQSSIVFNDLLLTDLNDMAQKLTKYNNNTYSFKEFYNVSINSNSTVSDYINVIDKIKKEVEKKYNRLD